MGALPFSSSLHPSGFPLPHPVFARFIFLHIHCSPHNDQNPQTQPSPRFQHALAATAKSSPVHRNGENRSVPNPPLLIPKPNPPPSSTSISCARKEPPYSEDRKGTEQWRRRGAAPSARSPQASASACPRARLPSRTRRRRRGWLRRRLLWSRRRRSPPPCLCGG